MTRLPPGLSARQFAAAMAELRAIVGADWLFTSDEDIWTYRDAYTPFRGDDGAEYIPCGAIAPVEVRQVQQIVGVANRYRLPLWPFSTGRNLNYGGSAPRLSGTLMVDLKRMNRVLEVDESRAYALVEPGVSYFDLYAHLRARNLKLWVDCADPGWGSVIGNALDRGVGHTLFRDHFSSLCGLEVVLPNGDLMRTGAGSIPDNKAWHTFPYGFGPHVAPLFGQGNFGIVTKAGVWLLPEPEASRSDLILVPRHEDIHAYLDTMASLVAAQVLDSSWTVEEVPQMSFDPAIRAAREKSGGEPSPELVALLRERSLPYWRTRIYLHGADNLIDAKWELIRARLTRAVPGVTFQSGKRYRFPDDYQRVQDGDDGDIFARAARGIPNMSIYGLGMAGSNAPPPGGTRARDNYGNLAFSPIVAMSGAELLRARRVFRQTYREQGMPMGIEIGGWAWFRCSLVLLYAQNITDDAAENARRRAFLKTLVRVGAENGWGEYRTHTSLMDDVMAAQSFNGNALLRFHEAIKDAVDPNGIMAPGRSGIWPKSLRGRKPI